jgi:peptidyl-tRNA hydrolase, PTH1 family
MPAQPITLIVGLGNPGPEYAHTRHNAGAWFIETLCQEYRLSLKNDQKLGAQTTKWLYGGKEYKIVIPNTFMNHSGQIVAGFAKYWKIPPQAILVAHDELDFEPGVYRFKTDGGHAGHNGLRDLIHHLHSREFHRVRIGIGHPGHKNDVADYVLKKPSREEDHLIRNAINGAIRQLPDFINTCNKMNSVPPNQNEI